MSSKWEVVVYLGITSNSSAFRLGAFLPDDRVTTGPRPGWKWNIIENNTGNFVEQVLVEDCYDMCRPDAGAYIIAKHRSRFPAVPRPLGSLVADESGRVLVPPDRNLGGLGPANF